MPNSSRTPQPGDSSVDFSHLSEADDAPPWLPPPSDSAVDFGTDEPNEDDGSSTAQSPTPDDSELNAGAANEEAETEPSVEDAANRDADLDVPDAGTALPEGTDSCPDTLAELSPLDSQSDGSLLDANAEHAPINPSSHRRLLLILLVSYASAITLAFLWLLFNRQLAAPHQLESLPDVAPLGPNEFRYVPEDASLPPGHRLPLGGDVRLGHIRIEPLRVTRGPVEFTHFADGTLKKPPTEPVLKLWLRLTNVSADQLIAPLDRKLLFERKFNELGEPELANQIVVPARRSESVGMRAFVLDHPQSSEWDLTGQQLGHRLMPGESIETYIPTNPGDDRELTGEFLWRVHLRKGYHEQTGRGVTTLIEVPFRIDDVQSEPAPS